MVTASGNKLPGEPRATSRAAYLAGLPFRHYLGIPAPIRILTIGIFINRAGGFVAVFLTLILSLRHVPADEIAIALVMSAISTVTGAWLGGAVVTRLGTSMTIFLAMLGSAVFTAVLAVPSPFPITLAIVCLISLFSRAQTPAAATMVGRLSRPDQRVQMYSFFQLCFNAGAAVGPAIAGYLITRSLTVLLLADAATSALYGVLSLLRLPSDRVLPSAEPRPGATQLPAKIRQDRVYLLFCVGVALVFAVFSQANGPFPLIFKTHHYSFQLLGFLFTGNAIAVILFQLPLSYTVRKLPPWIPLTFSAVMICGGYALLLVGISLPLLIVNVALWTAGDIIICPVQLTVATIMSTPRTLGSYQGALGVARSAGLAGGPALGVLAYSTGAALPWLGSAVIGVITVGLFSIFLRRLPKMDESAAAEVRCT